MGDKAVGARAPPCFCFVMIRLFCLVCFAGFGFGAAARGAGDWGEFRGAGGTGAAAASRAPGKLGEPTWAVPVGAGLSAPVLAGGRLFLTAVEEGRLCTCALEASTGRALWKRQAPLVPLEKVHAAGSPAASTPVADGERVYVYFGSYGLICYDRAGAEQWKVPLPPPQSLYGMSTSLIAYGETLVLVLDSDANLPGSQLSQSKVIAVRKATGAVVWETPRPLVRSGWSTPTLWKHDGEEELVVLGSGRLTSYDPATGLEKWFAGGFSRETIAQPVCGRGLVFGAAAMLGGVADAQPDPEPFWQAMLHFDADGDGAVARQEMTADFTFPLRPELPVGHPGFGLPLPEDAAARQKRQGELFGRIDQDQDGQWKRAEFLQSLRFDRGQPRLLAVRPGGAGELGAPHIAWEVNRNIPEIPSPVFYEDRLYLVRSGGLLSCLDAASGKMLYTERLGAPGQYSASPVVAGDHLYLVSNPGVVSVVPVGDTFQLRHQRHLGEAAYVTPALDDETLYIRTQGQLVAFRAEPRPQGETGSPP